VSDSPRVGFVGLGTMGRPMAHRLIQAAFAVDVYDVNAEAVDELLAGGAGAPGSLESLGEVCDIVMIAVVNERQVREVLGARGERGLLARMRPGTVVLIHSTIHPDACRELAEISARHDITVLDAPMTGNQVAAAGGELSMMVGGSCAGLERARPALLAVSSAITYLGPVGTGQIAKIANNAAIGVTMRAVCEALRFARAFGIEPETMLPLLTSGGADSWVARNWLAIGQTADSYPGGALGLGHLTYKDLSLALSLAHGADVSIPTVAVASQLLGEAYACARTDMLSRERTGISPAEQDFRPGNAIKKGGSSAAAAPPADAEEDT